MTEYRGNRREVNIRRGTVRLWNIEKKVFEGKEQFREYEKECFQIRRIRRECNNWRRIGVRKVINNGGAVRI